MTAIADAHPGAAVEVWCQDEARYGLIPTQRRVWAPRGRRPTCSSRRRYQWSYLYGFVHPASGSLLPYILPLVNRDAFRISLALFASRGLVDWAAGAWLAAGGVVGGWWGARYATRVDPTWLKRALIVAVWLAAARFATAG